MENTEEVNKEQAEIAEEVKENNSEKALEGHVEVINEGQVDEMHNEENPIEEIKEKIESDIKIEEKMHEEDNIGKDNLSESLEHNKKLKEEAKSQEENNEKNISGHIATQVHISLTNEKSSQKKAQVNIANSLMERKLLKDAKINHMRLKKKANEIEALQPAPIISKSSQILTRKPPQNPEKKDPAFTQPKKKKFEKKSSSKSPTLPLFTESPIPSNTSLNPTSPKSRVLDQFDNSELMRSAIKLRDGLKDKPEPPVKSKLDLVQRGEISKEKKQKNIDEAEKIKNLKELQGCTFKPKLKTKISESGSCIMKVTDSEGSINASSEADGKMTRLEFEEQFQLTDVKPLGCEYSKLSPVSYNVTYKGGYNEQSIKSKAQPMLNYRIIGQLLV